MCSKSNKLNQEKPYRSLQKYFPITRCETLNNSNNQLIQNLEFSVKNYSNPKYCLVHILYGRWSIYVLTVRFTVYLQIMKILS